MPERCSRSYETLTALNDDVDVDVDDGGDDDDGDDDDGDDDDDDAVSYTHLTLPTKA